MRINNFLLLYIRKQREIIFLFPSRGNLFPFINFVKSELIIFSHIKKEVPENGSIYANVEICRVSKRKIKRDYRSVQSCLAQLPVLDIKYVNYCSCFFAPKFRPGVSFDWWKLYDYQYNFSIFNYKDIFKKFKFYLFI